jgi:hypothetical protein
VDAWVANKEVVMGGTEDGEVNIAIVGHINASLV